MIVDNNALKFRKDNLEIFEVIGRLNKDLKEVLFSSSNELNSLIINFKQKKIFELYHKNLENLNKKDIGLFYLSQILEVVSIDYLVSKKLVEENIIGLADIFVDIPEIFIPIRMGYRGRIYCESGYLNYQGTDLAKSLLLFAKGEKILKSDIDSINSLKILGAILLGVT